MRLQGRGLSRGKVEAEAIVTHQPFSISAAFGAALQLRTEECAVWDRSHELYGKDVNGKVLFFPYAIGTTTTSFVLLEAIVRKMGPKAIVCGQGEPLLSAGAVAADIFYNMGFPIVDQIRFREHDGIETGVMVRVNGDEGAVQIM